MDAYLAITSRRDVKTYRSGALEPDAETRILDAGRLSGSARNRQPWRFLVIRTPSLRDELAACVYVPENVQSAAFVVAIVGQGKGPVGFDCGRAAQSMLLSAWNEGIGSSPNGVASPDEARKLLALGDDETLYAVLSFGHPAREAAPESRSPAEWSSRANRRSLDEVAEEL
jgi:nitroreductase